MGFKWAFKGLMEAVKKMHNDEVGKAFASRAEGSLRY